MVHAVLSNVTQVPVLLCFYELTDLNRHFSKENELST